MYQRSLIVFGGPLANFLLAILIFSFIYMFVGKDFSPAKIAEVQVDSPAYKSGLKKNDIIISINDNKVKSVMEVPTFINTSTKEIIFYDNKSDRTFHINTLVYNPGKSKAAYIRQLENIAKSIKTSFD